MMKTLKSISIFFLLIVLTCGVVFVPQIISGQKEEHILNEVFHRNYSTGNRPKLTNKQVARLYYNREITIGYLLVLGYCYCCYICYGYFGFIKSP